MGFFQNIQDLSNSTTNWFTYEYTNVTNYILYLEHFIFNVCNFLLEIAFENLRFNISLTVQCFDLFWVTDLVFTIMFVLVSYNIYIQHTNMIKLVSQTKVPHKYKLMYATFILNYISLKSKPYIARITDGLDKLVYSLDIGSCVGNMWNKKM